MLAACDYLEWQFRPYTVTYEIFGETDQIIALYSNALWTQKFSADGSYAFVILFVWSDVFVLKSIPGHSVNVILTECIRRGYRRYEKIHDTCSFVFSLFLPYRKIQLIAILVHVCMYIEIRGRDLKTFLPKIHTRALFNNSQESSNIFYFWQICV